MEIKFLEPVMVKSKLRRAFCSNDRKEWVIDRFNHPRRGIVIGWRTLADGVSEISFDEPTHFRATEHFNAVFVVFNERQNPVYVLPEECYEV